MASTGSAEYMESQLQIISGWIGASQMLSPLDITNHVDVA